MRSTDPTTPFILTKSLHYGILKSVKEKGVTKQWIKWLSAVRICIHKRMPANVVFWISFLDSCSLVSNLNQTGVTAGKHRQASLWIEVHRLTASTEKTRGLDKGLSLWHLTQKSSSLVTSFAMNNSWTSRLGFVGVPRTFWLVEFFPTP